jgi:uracil-DNA glycosylase family 4
MPLFEQGIALVVEHLKNVRSRSDLRTRQGVLGRIAALKDSNPADPTDTREAIAIKEPKPIEEVVDSNFQETFSHRATPMSVNEFPETKEPPEALEPVDGALSSSKHSTQTLDELRSTVLECTKCPHLVNFRHSVVFGVGNPNAELMFIGEAPGADEDMQGEPFVGRAGDLLTKIIQTMGFRRDEVYIANVLKCRPDIPAGAPGNRQPTPIEMNTCLPYLREQIDLIKPKIVVALGGVAMKGLLGKDDPMKNMRGRWHTFQSIPVMATFHPSYLLRNQALSEKRKVWEDMLLVLERLRKPISEKQRNYFLSRS